MKKENIYTINEIEKSQSRLNSSDIPMKDLFFIGDLDKYYKYGIFPYILIIHIVLVIFTTSLVIQINLDNIEY